MPLTKFQKALENDLKKSVKLVVKDNCSTMLSVKWEPNCTKISLHKFFLKAPEEVMDSLANYIKHRGSKMSPGVKSFIQENVHKLDYSAVLDKHKLEVQGRHYNLRGMLDDLNREYFDNRLNLNITWFGKEKQSNRSKVTFGLYHDTFKLIKINRLLDSQKIPEYMLSFVIYHEMLHHICPSYVDKTGRRHVHSKEFKAMEEKFRYYACAQEWINRNRDNLFSTSCYR